MLSENHGSRTNLNIYAAFIVWSNKRVFVHLAVFVITFAKWFASSKKGAGIECSANSVTKVFVCKAFWSNKMRFTLFVKFAYFQQFSEPIDKYLCPSGSGKASFKLGSLKVKSTSQRRETCSFFFKPS